MRYLGIDLGDKRTGLALGDSETKLATPVDLIEVSIHQGGGEALVDAIVRAIDEHLGPGELVMGMPLNMDDSEGPRAKLARAMGTRLEDRTGLVVHFHDERLTSAEADRSMSQSGLTRGQKKRRRDAIAAAKMLQDFLDTL